jgi:hypothetical protein
MKRGKYVRQMRDHSISKTFAIKFPYVLPYNSTNKLHVSVTSTFINLVDVRDAIDCGNKRFMWLAVSW